MLAFSTMQGSQAECPICGKRVAPREGASLPFCSPRCKLVDLQRWLGGTYRVPGEPVAEPPKEDT